MRSWNSSNLDERRRQDGTDGLTGTWQKMEILFRVDSCSISALCSTHIIMSQHEIYHIRNRQAKTEVRSEDRTGEVSSNRFTECTLRMHPEKDKQQTRQ